MAALTSEGRSAPKDVLGFAVGRHSYRWIYVPAENGGENVFIPVGRANQERRAFESVALLTAATATASNLPNDPYCLVRVEVNGGLGSPEADRFVATELRLLDQTRGVSIDVMAAVRDAQDRFAFLVEKNRANFEELMVATRQEALGTKEPNEATRAATDKFVTWLPDDRKLLIRFTHRIAAGRVRFSSGADRDEPRVARPKPIRHQSAGIRYGTEYGIRQSAEYEYDQSGKLVGENAGPIVAFINELKPPK